MSITEVIRTLKGILGKRKRCHRSGRPALLFLRCYGRPAGTPAGPAGDAVEHRAGGRNCEGGATVQAACLSPGLRDQPERGNGSAKGRHSAVVIEDE